MLMKFALYKGMTTKPEDIQIELEFTPNPDTLKYATDITLVPNGVANFTDAKEAEEASPLALKLFALGSITAVMIGKNFVSVTLSDPNAVAELNDKIIMTLQEYLATGERVVTKLKKETPTADLGEIETKIVQILDAEIRPAVAMDGGDIAFEKYEDGVVYLKMQGACSGCPSSMMTLKMGVETRLKEAIPEIIEVIPV
jgi:Fe-S cluster biogenesis protein NfuA